MDNFEKDILDSFENPNEDENSVISRSGDSNTNSNTSKTLVICFPRTKIEAVEVYLRSRNIDNYETVFDFSELNESFIGLEQVSVYLFDFIGEPRLRDLFIHYRNRICNLTVFTDKQSIAEMTNELTDNVFLISQLIDILTLFWDSETFSYSNVKKAKEYGIDLVNKRALEIQGKKLDRLDVSFAVEKEKPNKYSESVSYINIEKKFQGKDIGKVESSNFLKRTLNNLFGRVKEELFEEDYDESERLVEESDKTVYRLESPKIENLVSKLNNCVESSMTNFLISKGVISEEVAQQIETLKDLKQISGLFCEVDFAISKGLIDEIDSINLVNDYYSMYCMQKEDVLSSTILLDEFKFEGCREYKCFCTRGMRRDVNYFVVDPDNEYGKHKIEEMFNDFEYIYTKERYIIEKLRRMEVR